MYVFCLTPRAMPTSNFPHFQPVTTASSPPWTFRSHREERPSQCGYCNFPRCQLHPHPSLPPPQMESSISSPVEQSSTPLTVSLGFFSPQAPSHPLSRYILLLTHTTSLLATASVSTFLGCITYTHCLHSLPSTQKLTPVCNCYDHGCQSSAYH